MSDLLARVPRRIQRSRAKGWRMPEGAISVTRPGAWGNPFRIERDHRGLWWCVGRGLGEGLVFATEASARRQAIRLFCEQMPPETVAAAQEFLRGHDLACWCAPAPEGINPRLWCHADMLIEIANG